MYDILSVSLSFNYSYFIIFVVCVILGVRKRETQKDIGNPLTTARNSIKNTARRRHSMKRLSALVEFLVQFGDMFPDHMYIGK